MSVSGFVIALSHRKVASLPSLWTTVHVGLCGRATQVAVLIPGLHAGWVGSGRDVELRGLRFPCQWRQQSAKSGHLFRGRARGERQSPVPVVWRVVLAWLVVEGSGRVVKVRPWWDSVHVVVGAPQLIHGRSLVLVHKPVI